MNRVCSPIFNEQDIQLLGAALDALVKRDGIQATTPIAIVLSKMDGAMIDLDAQVADETKSPQAIEANKAAGMKAGRKEKTNGKSPPPN